jgi:hypothetical protein
MALQSSGAISLANIQSEFGGSNPISLSEYYRNGAYTTSNNTNVPTSGAISIDNFYGAIRAVYVTYEIIGAGGGGGGGLTTNTNFAYAGTAGGDSTITYTAAGGASTVITSNGGAGGAAAAQTGWGQGENSYYGSGGAGGANSDSNNQTAGYSPSATSYGAGGGGGGTNTFSDRDGGVGGWAGGTDGSSYTVTAWNSSATLTRYVGMPSTGTVLVVPGQTISITIGAGGIGGSGDQNGAKGANGYCKITFNGVDTEYTSPGTYTYTVPS